MIYVTLQLQLNMQLSMTEHGYGLSMFHYSLSPRLLDRKPIAFLYAFMN